MTESFKLSILEGGYYECTPEWWNWSKADGGYDPSFGFYLPVRGEASLEIAGGKCQLIPGHIYFVPGYHLLRQTCERRFSVYWVGFVPESFFLYHRLVAILHAVEWSLNAVPGVKPVFERFKEFFGAPEKEGGRRPVLDPPPGLAAQIEGVLVFLVGKVIESTENDFRWKDDSGLVQLKPAIDFMNQHYLLNPSLEEIAHSVHLAPNYFHRVFKRETGLTPFKHMENRRLDLARKLLFAGRLNITQVAGETGYGTVYYFSRAFRRRFGISPSGFRRRLGGNSEVEKGGAVQ